MPRAASIQQHQKAIRQRKRDYDATVNAARELIKEAERIGNEILEEDSILRKEVERLRVPEQRQAEKRKANDDAASEGPKKRKIDQSKKTKKKKAKAPKKQQQPKLEPCQHYLATMRDDVYLGPPHGLENSGVVCYSNAVLQALAVTVPTTWLYKAPSIKHKNHHVSRFLRLLRNIRRHPWQITNPQPAQEMVAKYDTTGDFDGTTQQDASEFLRKVIDIISCQTGNHDPMNPLQYISNPLIETLFRVDEEEVRTCHNCGDQIMQTVSEDWMLSLGLGVFGQGPFTVRDLLNHKADTGSNPGFYCEACAKTAEADLNWRGILWLPEVLCVKFNHTGMDMNGFDEFGYRREARLRYGVNLEPILDMTHFSINDSDRTKYELTAFVKQDGTEDLMAGHYIGYVKNVEDRWWCCNDETITSCNLGGAIKRSPGTIALAFYRRIGTPDPTVQTTDIANGEDNDEESENEAIEEVEVDAVTTVEERSHEQRPAEPSFEPTLSAEALEETLARLRSEELLSRANRLNAGANSWFHVGQWFVDVKLDVGKWLWPDPAELPVPNLTGPDPRHY